MSLHFGATGPFGAGGFWLKTGIDIEDGLGFNH
jgi:hypothetical protein